MKRCNGCKTVMTNDPTGVCSRCHCEQLETYKTLIADAERIERELMTLRIALLKLNHVPANSGSSPNNRILLSERTMRAVATDLKKTVSNQNQRSIYWE